MSKIRLWQLGSLEYQIAPTKKAASKLRELLESRIDGEDLDLIWGPDLKVTTIEGDEDYIKNIEENSAELIITEDMAKSFLESKGYIITKQRGLFKGV